MSGRLTLLGSMIAVRSERGKHGKGAAGEQQIWQQPESRERGGDLDGVKSGGPQRWDWGAAPSWRILQERVAWSEL